MENRIFDAIIIGAGPAGIFTALELTHLKPESQVLIVDMGRAIAHRTCPARTRASVCTATPAALSTAGQGRAPFLTASSPFPTRWAAISANTWATQRRRS